MSAPRPCYRHRPDRHMASCADCYAWHMPRARAVRDALIAAQAAARTTPSPGATTPAQEPVDLALVVVNPADLATAA